MVTCTVDAHKSSDVMSLDIPNAYIQTDVPEKNKCKGKRIVIKVRAVLVDWLCEIDPLEYSSFILYNEVSKHFVWVQTK